MDLLPEYALKWIEFNAEVADISTSSEMIDAGFVQHVRVTDDKLSGGLEATDMPELMRNMLNNSMLIYPIYSTDKYSIGRMENFFSWITVLMPSSGVVLEERFYGSWNANGTVIVHFSALFSDGTICVAHRDVLDIFGSVNCKFLKFSQDNPMEKFEVYSAEEIMDCVRCKNRKAICDCTAAVKATFASLLKTNKPQRTTQPGDATVGSPMNHQWGSLRRLITSFSPIRMEVRLNIENAVEHVCSSIPAVLDSYSEASTKTTLLNSRAMIHVEINSDRASLKHLKMRHFQSLSLRSATPFQLIALPLPEKDYSNGFLQSTHEQKQIYHADVPQRTTSITKDNASCPLCGALFSRKYEVARHIRTVHENLKQYLCKICGKSFGLKQYLDSHVAAVHEKRRDAFCTICGMSFQNISKVRRHIRCVHIKEKPFPCPDCPHSFFQLSDLRKHCLRANHPFVYPAPKVTEK